jgi:ornithine cyclodeaminase/alanine dehydrogenase-like protein (mu-crystallin family)
MALFLNEKEVRDLLPMAECIEVLEEAFSRAGRGLADNRPRSRIRMPNGFLHFMAAATLGPGVSAFGYKAYATFPGSPPRFLVTLYDGETGELLSIMDAAAMGQVRTGAASGLATKYMARPEASTVGIIGAGYQARAQLEAVCSVRRVERVRAFSRTAEKRESFAARMSERLNLQVVPVDSAEACVREADIVITITSSREPVLKGEWLEEGAHVNAAGGNHWMRREIDDAAVQRAALIVVDDLEQAKLECGDLIWPAERGAFRWSMAHELKDLVSGRMAGRPDHRAITLFESQGVALEDVAAALHVYRKAKDRGLGQPLPF